jgi:hypothetical protein
MRRRRTARGARPAKKRYATSLWKIYSPSIPFREVKLFSWDDIPWTEIAFPSVHWALQHWRQTKDRKIFAPFTNPPGENGNFPPR